MTKKAPTIRIKPEIRARIDKIKAAGATHEEAVELLIRELEATPKQ